MPMRLQRAFRHLDLHTSMLPRLHACTSTHLQRSSRPSEVCLHASSAPLDLQTSRPLTCTGLQRIHTSVPPRRFAGSASPDLHASTSARLQRASSAPYLHASSSTYLQRACSVPATRLHVSIPPNLYVATPAARLHPSMPNSTSAHLQCAYRAPFVHTST